MGEKEDRRDDEEHRVAAKEEGRVRGCRHVPRADFSAPDQRLNDHRLRGAILERGGAVVRKQHGRNEERDETEWRERETRDCFEKREQRLETSLRAVRWKPSKARELLSGQEKIEQGKDCSGGEAVYRYVEGDREFL